MNFGGQYVEPDKKAAPQASKAVASRVSAIVRVCFALIIALVVSGYLYEILAGKIPEGQKLGAVDVAIIFVAALVVGVLLRPEFLDRLTRFKLGSVEFELEKLQQAQNAQRNELDDLRFVLTLLLQPSELQHLRDLEKGSAQNRVGSHTLRTELRKLRTLGLIQNCKDKHIADLKDQLKMDLKNIVELTKRGREYLERLGEYADETAG